MVGGAEGIRTPDPLTASRSRPSDTARHLLVVVCPGTPRPSLWTSRLLSGRAGSPCHAPAARSAGAERERGGVCGGASGPPVPA
jgi:hypothetical protein